MKSLFLFLALFGTANAATPEVRELPHEGIAVMYSEPGVPLNTFLAGVAKTMRDYTDRTGYEGCGAIAVDTEGRYGITLHSNHSHLGCAVNHGDVPTGMKSIGYGIHTHGRDTRFTFNLPDAIFSGQPRGLRSAKYSPDAVNHFSRIDYDSGAGYLATETGVIFQNGEGTERVVE